MTGLSVGEMCVFFNENLTHYLSKGRVSFVKEGNLFD